MRAQCLGPGPGAKAIDAAPTPSSLSAALAAGDDTARTPPRSRSENSQRARAPRVAADLEPSSDDKVRVPVPAAPPDRSPTTRDEAERRAGSGWPGRARSCSLHLDRERPPPVGSRGRHDNPVPIRPGDSSRPSTHLSLPGSRLVPARRTPDAYVFRPSRRAVLSRWIACRR